VVYDVTIIGAGVIGALAARELSRYELKVCILESEPDVAMGTSKANSAIVHAGYDALPGTLKALFNVKGNSLFEKVSKELDVPFQRIGSLVLAFTEKDMKLISELYQRGKDNGVPDLKILNSMDEVAAIEPNVSSEVIGALYAPSAGITCPYELVYGAVENAIENDAVLMLETKVTDIKYGADVFSLETNRGPVFSRFVINAAGLYADRVSEMAGDRQFYIKPRKGEYLVLDKNQGRQARTVVFQTPSDKGKGILVTPTVDGNLLIGPNSEDIDDREDVSTSAQGIDEVTRGALKSIPGINVKQVITSFAGLRATPSSHDFIISPSSTNKRFINAAGIESPGLTAAPAIAEYLADLLKSAGLELTPRKNFKAERKSITRFAEASDEEKAELICKNRLYGNIVCRCETVTEAEIDRKSVV
jgi:glycerol-3-phosphate dehydrogenase